MGIIKYISNIDCFMSIEKLMNLGYNFTDLVVSKNP